MNQSQSSADTMFPGDTMYDDYVADERDHIGADHVVNCGTCGVSLDADVDMFFETDGRGLICVECWISTEAKAAAS